MLTDAEHTAMDLTAQLWNALCAIAGDGPARAGDLAEMATHIHAIQHAIMAQAAARAHPDRYRLMGGDRIEPEPDCPWCIPGGPTCEGGHPRPLSLDLTMQRRPSRRRADR